MESTEYTENIENTEEKAFDSLNLMIEYETQLLKKTISLLGLYKYKTCLVEYGIDLKPHRKYTISEFVWGFIKDPSLANEVAVSLEEVLVDIRDEPPTMIVPEINIKKQMGKIQYSIEDRYKEIKSKLSNKNTLIIFQTGIKLYEMFFEDALIGRDLFSLDYDEELLSVLIDETVLPEIVKTVSAQEYDVIVYSSNEDGSDTRANHISSLAGQQLVFE